MFVLVDEQIRKLLSNTNEISSTQTIPDGLTEEQTDIFLRVLQAKKPVDIEDIATENIIELLHLVPDMAPYIGNSSIFDNGSDHFKKKLLNSPSMKRRRVL